MQIIEDGPQYEDEDDLSMNMKIRWRWPQYEDEYDHIVTTRDVSKCLIIINLILEAINNATCKTPLAWASR